jgi:hypothetical protein
VSFSRLYVNDVYEGIYALVEGVDAEYLARHLKEEGGYLFECGRAVDDGATPSIDDLAAYKSMCEPRTHALESDSTLYGPMRDLFRELNSPVDGAWRDRVAEYIDLRKWMTYVAIQTFLSASDGFLGVRGMSNLFVYRRVGTQKHEILSRDEDAAMTQVDWPIVPHDGQVLFQRALSFSDLREFYFQVLEACARRATTTQWLEAQVADNLARVAAAAREDPSFDRPAFDAAAQSVIEFARRRPTFVVEEVRQARAAWNAASAVRPSADNTRAIAEVGPSPSTGGVSSTSPSRSRNGREVSGTAVPRDGSVTTAPIVGTTPSGLTYLGAFRLPVASPNDEDHTFAFSQGPICFNPSGTGSLIVGGKQENVRLAQVTIPAPSLSTTPPIAEFITPFTVSFGGHVTATSNDIVSGSSVYVGGCAVSNAQVIVSVYGYYDVSGVQVRSHFVVSASDLSYVRGPYQIGARSPIDGNNGAWVAGNMSAVPAKYRSSLGGPLLTGQCCKGGITTTSLGPTLQAFDPAALGVQTPVPSTLLLGYPAAHPTLGGYQSSGQLYNGAANYRGGVVLTEGGSLLFFGRRGTGTFCYGEGTNNSALHGTLTSDGVTKYCYDPALPTSKGEHAYPYVNNVLVYSASDLMAVKAGTKAYWDVVPVAVWPFPYERPMGAAYDEATGRIFVLCEIPGDRPLVRVFQVAL